MESTNLVYLPQRNTNAGAVLEAPAGVAKRRERTSDMRSVRIPLYSRKYPGLYATVDEVDVPIVDQVRWYPTPRGKVFYAQGKFQGRNVVMHRFILNPLPRIGIDHINGDGLDNRRENLRICLQSENNANRKYKDPESTSRYRGVSWESRHKRWCARLQAYGVAYYLGEYRSEEEAARAWDTKATEVFGEYAALNFPREKTASQ